MTQATTPQLPLKRKFSLSFGYVDDFNSNEGMKHLPLSTMQFYSFAFDFISKATRGATGRALLTLGDLFWNAPYLGKELNEDESNWFLTEKWWPYLSVYHEFGHARAIRAFAPGKFLGYRDPSGGNALHQSALCYYLAALKYARLNDNAATIYSELNLKNPEHGLPIYAGGLNNEARLSSAIADMTYRNHGHIAYFGTYMRGRLAPITYTAKTKSKVVNSLSGDIGHIVNHYQKYKTPDFDMSYIQYGGWVSFLCSSSTYMFLKGYWDFIQTGDPIISTPSWAGIRLPDVNLYFTRKGLSLEIVSGYKLSGNLQLNLGVETVYYPRFANPEITPSINYTLHTKQHGTFEFMAGAVINTCGYVSVNTGVEWTDPINPFNLGIKVIHHDARTYVGERNITLADTYNHDIETVIFASYCY